MVNECFENASSSLDQCLEQQAKKIQQSPPHSAQRQVAISRLIQDILKSDKLGHPQRSSWNSSLYADLYNEALQKTLLEVCQKIDSYNPEHPVMAWVNFRLKYQFIAVANDFRKKGITQIPKALKSQPVAYPQSLDELDNLVPVEKDVSDTQLLRQFLKDDPENLLQKPLRGRPELTFQFLALARFAKGHTWTEISANHNVSVQTLCSFFNRQLRELLPYFRKYLED